jgi:hypothetical protein
MKSIFTDFNYPREKAIESMKTSIPAEMWKSNSEFVDSVRCLIRQHPVARHPAIEVLNKGELSHEAMKIIHMEYRHAIVQIFTDALLMAQHQSRQLEPRLSPGSKMAPRFLLTLNVLDEFGFRPGFDEAKYYRGNPAYAHYPLFEAVLNDLGITEQERNEYVPSKIASEVRAFLEASYSDYSMIAALLAVAEEEVILYSPPLRKATGAIGVNVETGYYYVHGVTMDQTAEAADDDHEDDLWLILIQACTPDRYQGLQAMCKKYCNLWDEFWSYQLRQLDLNKPDLAIVN